MLEAQTEEHLDQLNFCQLLLASKRRHADLEFARMHGLFYIHLYPIILLFYILPAALFLCWPQECNMGWSVFLELLLLNCQSSDLVDPSIEDTGAGEEKMFFYQLNYVTSMNKIS